MNGEQARIWKKVVIVYLKILSWKTKQYHEESLDRGDFDRNSNSLLPKFLIFK